MEPDGHGCSSSRFCETIAGAPKGCRRSRAPSSRRESWLLVVGMKGKEGNGGRGLSARGTSNFEATRGVLSVLGRWGETIAG